MADDYGEIVELGFEGVDKFATRFHDPVVDRLSKHRPFASRSKNNHDGRQSGQQRQERQRQLPAEEKPPPRRESPQRREPLEQQDLPPHPQWQTPLPPPGAPPTGLPYPPHQPYPGGPPSAVPYPGPQSTGQPSRRQLPRQRSYSEPRGNRYDSRSVPDNIGELDSDSDVERGPKSMHPSYALDRRRDDGRRDDGRYEKVVEDAEYYGPRGTVQQMVVRPRDANRYQGAVASRAPSPPSGYADGRAVRGRPAPRRQHSSSWSPPRRAERRQHSPSRRVRSKSPNPHHRALAMVVGALVGGMAGSRVKKSDTVPNTMATVGGAILGGLAGGEVEEGFDRHKGRRARQANERGEAREKRRLERDHNYD